MFSSFNTGRPELVSDEALQRLATLAGEGELRAKAIRSIESVRATLELDGWVFLQELHLDGDVVIRHGLVGPAGVVVILPAGRVPKYEHAVEADRQARVLARELGLRREDVIAVVALFNSDAPPGLEQFVDFTVCVIGDAQILGWLDEQPRRFEQLLLERFQAASGEHERRAASRVPLTLPARPRQG